MKGRKKTNDDDDEDDDDDDDLDDDSDWVLKSVLFLDYSNENLLKFLSLSLFW